MKKDNLGDRMKQFYETVPKTRLMPSYHPT